MAWNENLTTLNYLLSDLYDDKEESKSIVKRSLLNWRIIAFKDDSLNNWYQILDSADKQEMLIDLLEFILRPEEKAGSSGPSYKEAIAGILENLKQGLLPIKQSGLIDFKFDNTGYEKVTGSASTLLPIGFLEKGVECAKSVARIVIGNATGTGFVLGKEWLITNNHVLPDKNATKKAQVQFNYQKDKDGVDIIPITISLDPDSFFTSKDCDFTIAKLNANGIALNGLCFSKNDTQEGEYVNIIQHPSGGPKQIALYHNNVTCVQGIHIYYLTDTLPGSSGSPVFNSDWEVIALHHWGGKLVHYGRQNCFQNRGIRVGAIRQVLDHFKIDYL